jgi:hypothetical protein
VENLKKTGLFGDHFRLWQANSMQLTSADFAAQQFPRFRMLSVDGGHMVEAALRDLMLASCIIEEGGIVILDDYMNVNWLGVPEAAVLFVHHQERASIFNWQQLPMHGSARHPHD